MSHENWIKERPNAYPENFLPPHTDQFYATDIPMYYDDKHRFNMDRALSKEEFHILWILESILRSFNHLFIT